MSHSSALASKATGYPIARVAVKIALGMSLGEIPQAVDRTGRIFEPKPRYVVVKIPRFPFDKFYFADRILGTQMKTTGELMAIDKELPGALLKAIRSLDLKIDGLKIPSLHNYSPIALREKLHKRDDERLSAIAEALRRGWSVGDI